MRIALQWLTICCFSAFITACGGGGGGSGNSNSGPTTTTAGSASVSPSPSTTSETPSSTSAPAPVASQSIHITWTAPTTRVDGSALPATALAGYRLFYSREGSSASEDTVIAINGGNVTSTDLTLAAAGTYLFAITAIDSTGAESELSAPVAVLID